MKHGQLSEYFSGQAAKRLSAVEANPERSNQHELNGVAQLARILGAPIPRRAIPAQFLYVDDDPDRIRSATGGVTWYDARESHATRSEARLYFTPSGVSDQYRAGDLIVVGVRANGNVMLISAARGTSAEQQLLWLFGFGEPESGHFEIIDEDCTDRIALSYSSRQVLDAIGVDASESADGFLDEMLSRFGGGFPRMREFSAFSRSTLPDLSGRDNADSVLLEWMGREEALFRSLERHLVSKRLSEGFDADDVNGFIAYSLSIQNRRKARAGGALQEHLQTILEARHICFTAQAITENRSTADFLFPGVEAYRDMTFPQTSLTMLGVKSSCKDRWRQVLAEARRIERKHLLTLEPAISVSQTDEMQDSNLQLIVPRSVHSTYPVRTRPWLWDVERFLSLVKSVA